MPMDIMLNPILADEPPALVDKMESIFMNSDQIKNVKMANIDEKEIMESINKPNATNTTDNVGDENIYDEKYFVALGTELPVGFSITTSETTQQTTDWICSKF